MIVMPYLIFFRSHGISLEVFLQMEFYYILEKIFRDQMGTKIVICTTSYESHTFFTNLQID
jgi:hypothetical protein